MQGCRPPEGERDGKMAVHDEQHKGAGDGDGQAELSNLLLKFTRQANDYNDDDCDDFSTTSTNDSSTHPMIRFVGGILDSPIVQLCAAKLEPGTPLSPPPTEAIGRALLPSHEEGDESSLIDQFIDQHDDNRDCVNWDHDEQEANGANTLPTIIPLSNVDSSTAHSHHSATDAESPTAAGSPPLSPVGTSPSFTGLTLDSITEHEGTLSDVTYPQNSHDSGKQPSVSLESRHVTAPISGIAARGTSLPPDGPGQAQAQAQDNDELKRRSPDSEALLSPLSPEWGVDCIGDDDAPSSSIDSILSAHSSIASVPDPSALSTSSSSSRTPSPSGASRRFSEHGELDDLGLVDQDDRRTSFAFSGFLTRPSRPRLSMLEIPPFAYPSTYDPSASSASSTLWKVNDTPVSILARSATSATALDSIEEDQKSDDGEWGGDEAERSQEEREEDEELTSPPSPGTLRTPMAPLFVPLSLHTKDEYGKDSHVGILPESSFEQGCCLLEDSSDLTLPVGGYDYSITDSYDYPSSPSISVSSLGLSSPMVRTMELLPPSPYEDAYEDDDARHFDVCLSPRLQYATLPALNSTLGMPPSSEGSTTRFGSPRVRPNHPLSSPLLGFGELPDGEERRLQEQRDHPDHILWQSTSSSSLDTEEVVGLGLGLGLDFQVSESREDRYAADQSKELTSLQAKELVDLLALLSRLRTAEQGARRNENEALKVVHPADEMLEVSADRLTPSLPPLPPLSPRAEPLVDADADPGESAWSPQPLPHTRREARQARRRRKEIEELIRIKTPSSPVIAALDPEMVGSSGVLNLASDPPVSTNAVSPPYSLLQIHTDPTSPPVFPSLFTQLAEREKARNKRKVRDDIDHLVAKMLLDRRTVGGLTTGGAGGGGRVISANGARLNLKEDEGRVRWSVPVVEGVEPSLERQLKKWYSFLRKSPLGRGCVTASPKWVASLSSVASPMCRSGHLAVSLGVASVEKEQEEQEQEEDGDVDVDVDADADAEGLDSDKRAGSRTNSIDSTCSTDTLFSSSSWESDATSFDFEHDGFGGGDGDSLRTPDVEWGKNDDLRWDVGEDRDIVDVDGWDEDAEMGFQALKSPLVWCLSLGTPKGLGLGLGFEDEEYRGSGSETGGGGGGESGLLDAL